MKLARVVDEAGCRKRTFVFARMLAGKRPRVHLACFFCCVIGVLLAVPAYGQSSNVCNVQQGFSRADELLKAHQYASAVTILNRLQRCRNLSPSTRFALGWLYGRSHEFKTALGIFGSVPGNVPDTVTHQYAIALSEFELGNFARSAEAINTLSAGQVDSRSANLLGVSYSKLGRYDDAYRVFSENIERHPSDLSSYLNLITLLADAGHFADAATVANQAVNAFPDNQEVIVVRGSAYTLLGELDKAKSDFAEAARLSPHDAGTRFLLALCEYRRTEFAEAAAEVRTAIASGVEDSDLHYLLAECLLKTDSNGSQSAISELNRAIALQSEAAAARTLRGKLLLEEGKAQAAYRDLVLARRLDPGSRSAAYNLARAERELGMAAQANTILRQLDTQDTDTLQELGDKRLHQALGAKGPL
jgi:tetratricopeptide (TPR) repeat protein